MILSLTASLSTTIGSTTTQSHNTHFNPEVIRAVPSLSWPCAALGHCCWPESMACQLSPVQPVGRGAALLLAGTEQVVL